MVATCNQQIIEMQITVPKEVIRQWQLMEWKGDNEVPNFLFFYSIENFPHWADPGGACGVCTTYLLAP